MSLAITPAHLESVPSTPGALPCPSPMLRAVLRRVGVSITIACAIPAAVFYNYFGTAIREFGTRMEDFSLEFLNLTERSFGD